MTEEERKAKQRAYNNAYRAAHRDQINARVRAWMHAHPEKRKLYEANHRKRVEQWREEFYRRLFGG